MYNNPNKTASADSTGIIISFRDTNKHQWHPYKSQAVNKVQIFGTARYQEISKPLFNTLQQKLYAQAINGLRVFNEKQLAEMPSSQKSSITEKYNKAQLLLNNWKQNIVNEKVDHLLLSLFPKSSITRAFVSTKGVDSKIKNHQNFKELGITKRMVADKLVEFKILPPNFFSLA